MNPGTRDGFQVVRDRPTVHSSAIDQKTKQALAICHLFLNRNIALADIVRLLDEDNGTVSSHYSNRESSETAETNQGQH